MSEEEQDLTKSYTWRDLLDSGQAQAKLNEFAKIELPCIISSAKGRTNKEKTRIAFAQKQLAHALTKFVTKHNQYTGESKKYAADELKQSILDTQVIWGKYECDKWKAEK